MQPDGSRFLARDRHRPLAARPHCLFRRRPGRHRRRRTWRRCSAPDGRRLAARGWYDTEALAEDAGTVYVGIERVHRIVKFDFAKNGFQARGVPIPVPAGFKDMPEQ